MNHLFCLLCTPALRRSLLGFGIFLIFLLAAICAHAAVPAEELAGRYKIRDTRIDYSISIPQERPAAAIIIQYLPPQTKVLSSCPAYNSYDPETGEMKWLFADPEPGLLRIILELEQTLTNQDVRAEALFKDHSGLSSTYSIQAAPMRRRMLEGC